MLACLHLQLMKALEPYDPLFYEEPVCSAQNAALPMLAAHTHVSSRSTLDRLNE